MKGSNEPFERQELADFIRDDTLPLFDDKIKWRQNPDRRPRRRVSSSRDSSPERTMTKRNATGVDVEPVISKHQTELE